MKQALIRLGAVLNLLVLWSCFFAQLSPNIVSFVIIGVQFLHAARRFWNEECYSHSMEVSYYKFGEQEFFVAWRDIQGSWIRSVFRIACLNGNSAS